MQNPYSRHLQREHEAVNARIRLEFHRGCSGWTQRNARWFVRPVHRRVDDTLEAKQKWLRIIGHIHKNNDEYDSDYEYLSSDESWV